MTTNPQSPTDTDLMRAAGLEKMARAIYDAENGIDGDRIGTMIYENFRITAPDRKGAVEMTMAVCREAATAALAAWEAHCKQQKAPE